MSRNFAFGAAAFIAAISLGALPGMAAAQAAGAGNGATASSGIICKDGTTWTGKPGRGACRGHHGVDKARTQAAAGGAVNRPSSEAPSASASGAAGGAAGAPAGTASERTGTTRAAGGGGGQVWVNTSSKVYHCPGTRWYGKTKQGKYESESEAKAEGARPDHGKSCS
jgi:hypothetical protein